MADNVREVRLRWRWMQDDCRRHHFIIQELSGWRAWWGLWKTIYKAEVERTAPITNAGYEAASAQFRAYLKSRESNWEKVVVEGVSAE